MSVADALAVRPGLILAPADEAADRTLVERLADWCSHYTPWTAAGAWTEGFGLWLDVTGCAHLFGGEEALLVHLTRRLKRQGFSARAALADTPGAAWAWARHGAKHPCLPEKGQRDALARLPVAALRLGPEIAATLSGLGLRRIGDLYGIPRAGLAARCGRAVAHRLDQALGHESEPISPRRLPPSHGVHATFTEPVTRPEDMAEAVRRLLGRLCRQLKAEGLGGLRRLEVKAFRVDATSRAIAIAIGTSRPALDPGFGIELLRLSAVEVAPLSPEQSGLEAGDARPDEFARLLDSLGNRLGFDRVMRLVPQHSHVPERAGPRHLMAGPPPPGAAVQVEALTCCPGRLYRTSSLSDSGFRRSAWGGSSAVSPGIGA